jgi:DNA modification methylase
MGRGHYHWQHEPCWYAVKDKGTGHWAGDRKQSTLWEIANMHRTQGNVDDGKTSHGTQKPVECMKRPIENNSSPGQAVYEPFSGSGTTIMAGELTGRHIHAIELSPAYVDVAIKRWQDFTGKKATHAETGKTFEEMSSDRYDQGEWAKNTSESYDVAITEIRHKIKRKKAEAAE